MRTLRALRPLALLLLAAPLAQAHPGHGPADFISGLVHPLTGWDHVLAMVAVGLWAAQLGGRARWALPAAFVGAMMAGAAGGIIGLAPAGVETGILASVLILGVAVAAAARLPLGAGLTLVALAGSVHGLAHGAEMPLRAGCSCRARAGRRSALLGRRCGNDTNRSLRCRQFQVQAE